MIKIESVEGICTITRDGGDCVLFTGMHITADEVETIVANGDVVYSIDETQVVVVPKGTQATISAVVADEPAAEVPAEAAPEAEVVPAPVETPTPVAKKG